MLVRNFYIKDITQLQIRELLKKLDKQGYKIFTITNVYINQSQTQQNSGGLTDIYLDNGTYIKSFYSVICAPSCAKVATMGDNHLRIHHQISWNNCCPKIISEKYKRK